MTTPGLKERRFDVTSWSSRRRFAAANVLASMSSYLDAATAPLKNTGQLRLHGEEGFAAMRKACRLTALCLDELAAIPTELARFFTILDTPNKEYNASVGIEGSTHPDSLTAMLMVEPGLIVRESPRYVAVETTSELTRGYSLFDDRPARNAPNVRVIDEVDAGGFFQRYRELLAAGARARG